MFRSVDLTSKQFLTLLTNGIRKKSERAAMMTSTVCILAILHVLCGLSHCAELHHVKHVNSDITSNNSLAWTDHVPPKTEPLTREVNAHKNTQTLVQKGCDNKKKVEEESDHKALLASQKRSRRELNPVENISAPTRKTNMINASEFLSVLFEKYGENGTISLSGFDELLHNLGLLNNSPSHKETVHLVNEGDDKHHHLDDESHDHSHDHSDDHSHDHSDDHSHGHSDDHSHSHPDDHSHGHPDDHSHDQENEESHSTGYKHNSRSLRSLLENDRCVDLVAMLREGDLTGKSSIDAYEFLDICPLLITQLDITYCHHHGTRQNVSRHVQAKSAKENVSRGAVWGFSLLSCVLISILSLAGLPLIPIINKIFYNHLLQFLVALAIGTLSGDALLHLLPHAMVPHSSEESDHDHDGDHDHSHGNSNHSDSQHSHGLVVWFGLMALGGMYLFFLVERTMGVIIQKTSMRRARKQRATGEEEENGVMLNTRKRSSTKDSAMTSCEDTMMVVHTSKGIRDIAVQAQADAQNDCDEPQTEGRLLHSHSHGYNGSHGHQVPSSISSVAWMVIMGDGIHNFSDGLAIGAAFAQSMSSGLSTTVAVFCHELPHELGDFAVLLSVGMSMKRALFYNFISALLSLLGNVVGVAIGSNTSATPWILCMIAGMFLYVALVDMLPELTKMTSKAGESAMCHLVLQNIGILIGGALMLVIALYEGNIKFPVA